MDRRYCQLYSNIQGGVLEGTFWRQKLTDCLRIEHCHTFTNLTLKWTVHLHSTRSSVSFTCWEIHFHNILIVLWISDQMMWTVDFCKVLFIARYLNCTKSQYYLSLKFTRLQIDQKIDHPWIIQLVSPIFRNW